MDKFVTDQVLPTLRYLTPSLVNSFFEPKTSAEVIKLRRKTGGFVKGVCHPTDNLAQVRNANIEWVRVDIPFPFDEQGNITERYIGFKQKLERFRDAGLKVMAVTPYPKSYVEAGVDPRIFKNEKRVKEIAVFMITDLKDLIHGVQITNEMGLPHFTLPLNTDEAVRFMGINAAAMAPVKGNIIVGYNSAGPQVDVHRKMKRYHEYCDYVGIDIYIGCFFNVGGFMWMFDALLRYLWGFTKKPILLQEFGYISAGEPKTSEQKQEILRSYGVESEDEARENMSAFVAKLPEAIRERVHKLYGDDGEKAANYLFSGDMTNHLYRQLPKLTHITGYPHSDKGQSDFYRDFFKRLHKLNFVCGSFIYCYSDSERCYVCSQPDCPTETRWGLVSLDGKEKPSYYAVKAAFKEKY